MKKAYAFIITFALVHLVISCRKTDRLKTDVTYPAAYVINGESNSISIIALSSNEVKATAEFNKGSWPHHINPNSTKDKFIVSLTGTDLSGGHAGHGEETKSYLAVLRASDLKVLGFKKLDGMAHNALFVNDNDEIWVPQMNDGLIKILDAETLKEKSSIQVGQGPLEATINSGGNYVFASNGEDNTISVIDISAKVVSKTITVGQEPVGAWPGSNNKMYVDCELSKQVFEIDALTLEITDTIQLAFTPAYVAYNSAAEELWVSDTEFGGIQIYELSAGQWNEKSYLSTGAGAHAIAFNTAQDKAYVTNQGAATVSVIEVASFTKLSDVPVGGKPNGILIID